MSKLQLQSNGENQEQGELLTILRDEQLRESDNECVMIVIRRLGEMKTSLAIDDFV